MSKHLFRPFLDHLKQDEIKLLCTIQLQDKILIISNLYNEARATT